MVTYARPGTYVNETLLQQNADVNSSTAIGVFVAAAKRGPVTPTVCKGLVDVNRYYGGFTGVAADDVLVQALYDSISNGARTVVGVRAVGAGVLAASLPFNLSSAATPAVDFSAANPGVWGNNIYVEVLAGSVAGYVTLVVRYVPLGAAITNQQIVERYGDVSLDPSDPRYVVQVVNTQNGGSAYISAAVHTGYVFTAGDALAVSGVSGGSKLAGGADGAGVGSATILSAVYQLDGIASPFVLNVPGVTDTPTVTALADYADATRTRSDGLPGRGDVFVVVDTAVGNDAATAITRAQTYPASDALAVYYPPIVVSDPSNPSPGATKVVPVGPSVVGRYIDTDANKGVFKVAAGITDGYLRNALGFDPAATLKAPQLDLLNLANVNAVKTVPGRGICIYGARTLKIAAITRYVNARRTLIQVRTDLIAATAFGVFENNDSFLWGDLATQADKVLRELFVAGGLKGSDPEQAYFVKCDEELNTPAVVQSGRVILQVGLALQRPAEFVILNIGQFEGGAVVTESV